MAHPLVPYGWNDMVAALFAADQVPGGRCGRVIRVDRGACLVAAPEGVVRAGRPLAEAATRRVDRQTPATGDWVTIADDPDAGVVVVSILPRRSVIVRRHADAVRPQILAANVDVVAAVCPLDRPLGENRLERFLAVAWESGGRPAVVLTKADLAVDVAEVARAASAVAAGVDVLVTSATTGQGLEDLRALAAPDRTIALLGPSGAGKSTLVNELVGNGAQRTGVVRKADHRGRHTTSSRNLVPLPGGGVLIDTPGLRAIALWGGETGLAATFSDVEELAGGCRFRDCGHGVEPGCALAAASVGGLLDPRRLESYRKLQREVAALELQRNERERRTADRRSGPMARDAQRLKRD